METGFSASESGFDLHFAGRLVLSHSDACPALAMARGNPAVEMVCGNFRIEDAPAGLVEPAAWTITGDAVVLADALGPAARLEFVDARLRVELLRPGYDRIYLNFHAEPDETVWGGGEQMSYLALNGRAFPIWTSEPGVGRDKSTALTRLMDAQGMAGGDYWNTNYPQPTFLTSRWLAVHCTAESYAVMDFTDPERHRFEVWSAHVRQPLAPTDTVTVGVNNATLATTNSAVTFAITTSLSRDLTVSAGTGQLLRALPGVFAALLFGALYQGGSELAFEMRGISREMVIVIQGLIILFCGALENMFRPVLARLFAKPEPA